VCQGFRPGKAKAGSIGDQAEAIGEAETLTRPFASLLIAYNDNCLTANHNAL